MNRTSSGKWWLYVVLILAEGEAAPVCQYDVIEGRAYVTRM